MDGAAAEWTFTGKWERDAWTQDKRELVNILLVFREISVQIALKSGDTGEKKGTEKKKQGRGRSNQVWKLADESLGWLGLFHEYTKWFKESHLVISNPIEN